MIKPEKQKKDKKNIPIKTGEDSVNFLSSYANNMDDEADFFNNEGQLSCDVYQDQENIIVRSTMAGVNQKNLDISVSNDLLTIRGFREADEETKADDFYCREIYWGTFSRSIVLPQEVDQNKIEATLKNGILTVILPKKYKTTSITVKQIDD